MMSNFPVRLELVGYQMVVLEEDPLEDQNHLTWFGVGLVILFLVVLVSLVLLMARLAVV